MNNFDRIVSLGYNCFPCMYCKCKDKEHRTTSLFDDVATPAWAIKELLVNDFDGLFDENKFVQMYLFDNANRKFLTNVKYYIRYTNKYPQGAIKQVVKMLENKKNVFMNYLISNEKILFIRYEEPVSNDIPNLCDIGDKRIIYPAYRSYYANNEIYHLEQLSSYIQTTYPNLDFHIMFIGNAMNSSVPLGYDNKTKLFTFPNQAFNMENYQSIFDLLFDTYGQFITDSIANDSVPTGPTGPTGPIVFGFSIGNGITIDCNNNVYITGYFSGEIQIGPDLLTTPVTSNDMFVAQIDATTGTLLWGNQSISETDTEAFGITTDCNGNIYITGTFNTNTYFDTGSMIISLFSSFNDMFTVRVDPVTHDFVWAVGSQGIGNSNFTQGNSIASDCKNNIYVTGYACGNVQFGPAVINDQCCSLYVSKIDIDGNWIWTISGTTDCGNGGWGSYGYGITCDCDGNIYVCGSFGGNVLVGNYNLTSYNYSDILVAKINENGNWLWARNAGTPRIDQEEDFNYYCEANGICLDYQNNVYITGYFETEPGSTTIFGPFNITAINDYSDNIFTAKLDNNGQWIWITPAYSPAESYGYGNAITNDFSGNIYIIGVMTPPTTFGSIILNPLTGFNNIYVAKLLDDTQIPLIGVSKFRTQLGQKINPIFNVTESGNNYTDLIPSVDYGLDINGQLVPICQCQKCKLPILQYLGTACSPTQLLLNCSASTHIAPFNTGNIDTLELEFSLAFGGDNTTTIPYIYFGNNPQDIVIGTFGHIRGRTIHGIGAIINDLSPGINPPTAVSCFSVSLLDGTNTLNSPVLGTVSTDISNAISGNFEYGEPQFIYTTGPFMPSSDVLTLVINSSNAGANCVDKGAIWSVMIRYL